MRLLRAQTLRINLKVNDLDRAVKKTERSLKRLHSQMLNCKSQPDCSKFLVSFIDQASIFNLNIQSFYFISNLFNFNHIIVRYSPRTSVPTWQRLPLLVLRAPPRKRSETA